MGWCAYYGDVSAIRHLQAQGVELSTLGTDLGLIGASFHGHWRLCEYLIEQGADPQSTMPLTGETALHSALCKFESIEHERVIEVLLAAGALVTAATIPGVESGGFMRDVRTEARPHCTGRRLMAPPMSSDYLSRLGPCSMQRMPMATRLLVGEAGPYAKHLCCTCSVSDHTR